ncbi:DUF881 domain-containing protein [Senegalia massiliensis]|jgi:uncharacterized protein YlxW (UPF0749 family)|uniref:DUF881 domain-containing protein n=1 Tax=Senegalia massiliensis TaxID=1720316 RepID=UPI00102F6BB7|nr:DUF881 domain-containing protein [Senegalia massiliensis]
MKNLFSKSLIITVCVILGIIIAIQYKTVNTLVGPNFIPSQKNKELVNELSNVEKEKESLMNELENLENEIRKYESKIYEESDYVKELSKELDKYKMFTGYKEVEGKGVEIVINNPNSQDSYEYPISIEEDYDLILKIINDLNGTGIEAIAINDLRHTSFSKMIKVGEDLSFNSKPISAPIKIKAIGSLGDIKSVLTLSNGTIDKMESYGFEIEITEYDNIKIPRYFEIREFKYAKPISYNKK